MKSKVAQSEAATLSRVAKAGQSCDGEGRLPTARRDDYLGCEHLYRGIVPEPRRNSLLNRSDRPSPMAGEAEVKFLDGDFRIVRPGAFVRCAVSGTPIPLEELKYWSVDLQEAYASPEAVLKRLHPQPGK
jgi:hypothetical protein